MTGAPISGSFSDDCFRQEERLLLHDEAIRLILDRVPPIAASERIPIDQAVGRVMAETVVAQRNVPLTATSAVDGWAFAHADCLRLGGRLPISGRVLAGKAAHGPLTLGTAVRIFTGAAVPDGADTVAMQEDCRQDGEAILVPAGLKPGANRRDAGEDVAAGAIVIAPGTVLRPQELAAIGSLGMAKIAVTRRLRVALLSTGDEIVRPGQPIHPGEVYDANHVMLSNLLAPMDAVVHDLGILPDDAALVHAALEEAARHHDLILTSGGSSRGDGDHIAEALATLGHRHLWHLAIKPGKPLCFGQIGPCLFLGLPGNPVAALVNFLLYGQPLLARLSGHAWRAPTRFPVPAGFSIGTRKTGRREFLRGILTTDADGHLSAQKFSRDGSGLITGLRAADGLIEIPETVHSVTAGEPIAFIPFTEFGLPPRRTALPDDLM
ncbi:Molybdopterin molybdenumtransferase [Hartmannibacter diazotrophicus]|uniref:Molybdopterin molybdenumtransferase n=1 Tax=Hartmannibacter diazotrophicus TaxID=1482074 RepID=A0A2C9D8I6_9HYPH|nr:gephyrin-like molybdotransferase Glp [Hartmannibacter diazotrophicus]SON56448.1 Molybdopterin molybdenumtransferase [Hartmannibacter diazotrophicus]